MVGGTPPGDALPPPQQRATPARKGARCGAGAGSPRPHGSHPGHKARGTLAARSRGWAAGGGTASDTRRPSQRWQATPPGDGPPPPPRHSAPTGHAGQGDSVGPPHPHTRAHSTPVADPDSPPIGRAVRGGKAPDLRRASQWWKAPRPGTHFRYPHREKPRPARAHVVGPVLGPHARTDRTRDGRPSSGAGGQCSATRVSRVRSVRAWGPSTSPTACALAGRRCSLLGWPKGVPGGAAFHHCEGRLRSGAVPPPTARPLGGLLGSATHVLWARVCGCGGPILSPWPACRVGGACRGGGGGPSPGGVACHRCEGRLASGAVPPPAARPLERAAGAPRPVCGRPTPPGTAPHQPRGTQPPQGMQAKGTVLGPHTHTSAPTARGWRTPTARPVGGQSGEGQRLTSDAPHNAGRHPPRGRPWATPTESNAGPQGRTPRGRSGVPTPAPTAPGTHGSQNPGCPLQGTGG